MHNRRYHIHVICTAHNQPLVLDSLALFFQKKAFLTYDLNNQLANATFYSRQNIDACDYVVVVIGDRYGSSPNVVVSQMHLSYLGAKAKLKPMLILIKTHLENEQMSWQLADFMRLVEQQSNRIYYYDDNTNIEKLLSYAYNETLVKHPLNAEWVRQGIISDGSKSTNSQKALPKSRLSISKSVDIATDNLTTSIPLNDTFEVKYSAQAYEGGNLTDITMSTTFSWQQILFALAKIPAAFSSYGLQNCLNNLITSKAEAEIKFIMPNVHAVSRYKIAQDNLLQLQKNLIAANWIQIITSATAASPELWKLTYHAKKNSLKNCNNS